MYFIFCIFLILVFLNFFCGCRIIHLSILGKGRLESEALSSGLGFGLARVGVVTGKGEFSCVFIL